MPVDWSKYQLNRSTFSVIAVGLVEAAMWALTDNLPQWFLWLTIILGLLFVVLLNIATEQSRIITKAAPWCIGFIYILALIGAFVISARSAISAHIETSSLFYRPDKKMIPMLSAIVTLTNDGSYVTNAHDFVLSIYWTPRKITHLKAGLLDQPITLPYINGRLEQMLPEDDLSKKSFAPIPIGNQVRGRLIFQGWSIQPERLRKERPTIKIVGVDSHGKQFYAVAPHDETGEVIIPPYGEYSGLRQRFLR
jgi:hypothetical protein